MPKLIPVRPKNYRRVALAAVEAAAAPIVLLNGQRVHDLSEQGPVTQRGIRACRDFEVRDGTEPVLGFHDHPDEMWVAESFAAVAELCAREGWLKIEGPAS